MHFSFVRPRGHYFFSFSFGQPKEKANKKKGCRLRIRCYSGDSAGYSARKLAATRGSSDRCLTSRRPHRLRLTPRMLMSGDPDGRQAIGTCHGASHNSSFLQSRCGVSGRIFASHRRRRWRSVVVKTRLIASLLGFHAFIGRQAIHPALALPYFFFRAAERKS